MVGQRIVTAGELLIQTLYHYQAFDLERVTPIISSNRLYYSKPYDFNDPWDCRPAFDVEGLFDPATREQTAIHLEEVTARRGDSPEKVIEYGKRLRTDIEFIRAEVQKMSGLADQINEWYRTYSLAWQPDVPLMWSHYARGHTGICLEFDSTTDFIARALKVQYYDEYPTMPVGAAGTEALMPVLSKSEDWSYEVEYRLFALDRDAPIPGLGVDRVEDHWLTMPPGTLKSVIVGCQMPAQEREKVKALVRSAPGRIELKQAVKVHDRYAVRIEPLP